MSEGNGDTKAPEKLQLVLEYDPTTATLKLGGNVMNLDMMLNMLAQATRFIDVKYRIVAAMQAQEEAKQAALDFKRVQTLLGKQ